MTDDRKIQEALPGLVKDLWREAQSTIKSTEAQIATFMNRLVEGGNVSQEEAKKVSSEMGKRLKRNREEMSRFLENRLDSLTRALPVPTRKEVDELRGRIEQIGKRIDRLAKKVN